MNNPCFNCPDHKPWLTCAKGCEKRPPYIKFREETKRAEAEHKKIENDYWGYQMNNARRAKR